jgi:molybdopterin converting factor subunit 1
MTVRVRFFAFMAQTAGTRDVDLELSPRATLSDLQRALKERLPELRWPRDVMWAVNQEYTGGANRPLNDGDEVAIIPPVSGG